MPRNWQRDCCLSPPSADSLSYCAFKGVQNLDTTGPQWPREKQQPHDVHGRLTKQRDLPDSVYAFPTQRKEPLTDAQHVRNAVARFDQVIDVCDADRDLAFANIEKAANYDAVNLAETSWHDLGIHPQKNRRDAAAKGAVTRERRVQSQGSAGQGVGRQKK